MAFVCFVIPTIGRPSISRSVESLFEQTDGDWVAIIVADGARRVNLPAEARADERIMIGYADRTDSAGLTRNWGVDMATMLTRTEWVAFLDDDDYLSPEYVAHLREQAEDYPQAEVIVARMKDARLGIVPDPAFPQVQWGSIGISFAVKQDTLRPHEFCRESWAEGRNEDWEMIRTLRGAGARIHISPHIDYFVREATP